jgi:putative integral membrane protein (TIGR02587 family)
MQRHAAAPSLRPASPAQTAGVGLSLREYGRGLAGGLIFSLPLLYTMEVWWAGFVLSPWRLLLALPVTFALLLGYNRFAGLRPDASWLEVAIDSVEELGLGIAVSALVLWILGRVTAEMPVDEIIDKVTVEAIIVAIGVSVGTAQLSGSSEEGGMTEGGAGAEEPDPQFGEQLVLAICGAVLFAINVAPTEEIQVIGLEADGWRLLGIGGLSLALGAVVLYFSDFSGAQRFVHGGGWPAILVGLAITYAAALVASAGILWFFGRFDGMAPAVCVAQVVVLGLAATLGASAGRLLIQ